MPEESNVVKWGFNDVCFQETGYGAAELINYKRDGTPFRNRVALIPVYNNVDAPVLTNTLGLLDAIDLSDSER